MAHLAPCRVAAERYARYLINITNMTTFHSIIERYFWVIPFIANCLYSFKNYDDIRKTDLLRYYNLDVKTDSRAILIYQLGVANIPFLFYGLRNIC